MMEKLRLRLRQIRFLNSNAILFPFIRLVIRPGEWATTTTATTTTAAMMTAEANYWPALAHWFIIALHKFAFTKWLVQEINVQAILFDPLRHLLALELFRSIAFLLTHIEQSPSNWMSTNVVRLNNQLGIPTKVMAIVMALNAPVATLTRRKRLIVMYVDHGALMVYRTACFY